MKRIYLFLPIATSSVAENHLNILTHRSKKRELIKFSTYGLVQKRSHGVIEIVFSLHINKGFEEGFQATTFTAH